MGNIPNKQKQPVRSIQSVRRAMQMIEFIAANGNQAGLTVISRGVGLSKSTAYGLLATLEQMGYVRQDAASGEYALGMKLFELGQVVHSCMDVRALALPYLHRLQEKFQETVHLAVLTEGEVVYIEKVDSNRSMRIISEIGGRNPAYCTGVGKVLLAGLPDCELEPLLNSLEFKKYTPNTITEPDVLKEHLIRIQKQGFAVDREEIETGLVCVASPVKNHQGKVVAAISLSGPAIRVPAEMLPAIQDDVMKAAGEISLQLGWRNP